MQIVFFGGHVDSWDMGNGVQDDGIGVIMAAEVIVHVHINIHTLPLEISQLSTIVM